MRARRTCGLSVAALALSALLGCPRERPSDDEVAEPEPSATPASAAAEVEAPAASSAPIELAYLEDALLEASYDTTTLAELGRSLPRPSPTGSPLVGLFGAIVDAFVGDPAQRLEALGLQPDARVHLSLRALDGRAAAVRKLLGELASDAAPDPALVAELSGQARALGVHLRASLPTRDQTRLLRAVGLLTLADDDLGPVAEACASLRGAALCTGRSRLIVWARPLGEDRLRVDGIYLFYPDASVAELRRALARADGFASASAAPEFAASQLGARSQMQVLIHAGPTRKLLRTEALADAAVAFARGEASFDAYLDRERALRELVPEDRVFDGVSLELELDRPGPGPGTATATATAADGGDDQLRVRLRWLAASHAGARSDELFAPVAERGTLPVIHGDCEAAQACLRVGGLSTLPRFSALATGPFADTTGMFRVLRQAGDRGSILVGLSAWPHLLGTAGALVDRPGRGVTARAMSATLRDSYGFGLFLLELGAEPEPGAEPTPEPALPERWVGYLRVGAEALDALRPAAALAGLGSEAVEGVEGRGATIDRGSYEGVAVYLVDEALRRGGFGGWLLAADGDARVGWLLDTPREVGEGVELDPVWYLRVASLGPVAARERISYTDDPPIRRWLDRRSLELRGSFHGAAGPRVELTVGPRR